MANPQWEKDGYTKIATPIVENLMKIRIPGEANQVFWCIIRFTYGWGNKWAKISNKQFCLATGLKKVAVSKAINKLLEINIIYKNMDNYALNKNYEKWKPLPKKEKKQFVTKKGNNLNLLPKKVTIVTKKGNTSIKDNIYTSFFYEADKFKSIVLKYKNYKFVETADLKWLYEEVLQNAIYSILDIKFELTKWGNYLETEFRKKESGEKNKFPASNYKNSLLNFLNIALKQNKTFQKGKKNVTSGPDRKETFEQYGTGIQHEW